MSTPDFDTPGEDDITSVEDPDELGSLSIEDDPEGTVDPSELAGTAQDDDEDVR